MISQDANKVLLQTATIAQQHLLWTDFAEYCLLRERGLRKAALQRLNSFLAQTRQWAFPQRQEFVLWLCNQMLVFGGAAHGLDPYPLPQELVLPTLAEWIQSEPQNVNPHRILGIRFGQREHVYRVLELDPTEQGVRRWLVGQLINDIWHATHHLPDYYIGEPQDGLKRLLEAKEHITFIEDDQQRQHLSDSVRYYGQLIQDWQQFKASDGTDFTRWCQEHERAYTWVPAFYYTKT